jgi:hypothetical protein
MRRYAILLALLLAGLYWFGPWLRQMNAAEAAAYPWLPVLDPGTWNMIILGVIVVAVVVGFVLLVKLGFFIWRELGD